MYKVMGWSTFLLLSSFLAGCSRLTDSGSNEKKALSTAIEDFSIETDQDVYVIDGADSSLEITYAYVNKGKQAFYPSSCLGVASDVLEKLVDEEWVLAYAPACPQVLRPPIEIEAETRYEATIQLHPSTWDPGRQNASWYGGDIEGIYRVREQVYDEWDQEKFDKGTLTSETVVSNTFEIRRS